MLAELRKGGLNPLGRTGMAADRREFLEALLGLAVLPMLGDVPHEPQRGQKAGIEPWLSIS
jgi:hypothetical protein